MSPEETGWYVFALTASNAAAVPALPPDAAILPGARLEFITGEGLAALVSAVPRALFAQDAASPAAADPAWVAARASAHHGVVTALHTATPCLPLGFGTLFASRASVSAWLSRIAPSCHAALGALAGREEWVLRLSADQAALSAWAMTCDPECATLQAASEAATPGRAVLLRKQLSRLAEAAGQRLLQRFAAGQAEALAAAEPVAEPPPPGAAYAWRLLTPRGASPACPAASPCPGAIATRLAGPFAPYGFTREALKDAA